MGTHQAIYDAVRSKISGGDIGSVFEQVAREALDISFRAEIVAQEYINAAHESQRPCVLFKPTISLDGDQYCALLGEDLMNGVAGFGKTMAAAMWDFYTNSHKQEPTAPAHS